MASFFELNSVTARSYVANRLHLPEHEISATELGGGVSNRVFLVAAGKQRLVLKQALGQLRVEQEWLCTPERIWQESAALAMLAPLLPAGAVPQVLWDDHDSWLYAMSAASENAETWKQQLLRGDCDLQVAENVGGLLAALCQVGWESKALEQQFGDLSVFDQLRLAPYYAECAKRHPDLEGHFRRLIDSSYSRRCTLVHGDWSPKNFLVSDGRVMAIDFEVIHYGDPSFDAAFLLNHLLLKSFHLPKLSSRFAALAIAFWTALLAGMPPADWFENASIAHLGALLLARVDGKSPAEYIRAAETKQHIRDFARELITHPPATIDEVFQRRQECL